MRRPSSGHFSENRVHADTTSCDTDNCGQLLVLLSGVRIPLSPPCLQLNLFESTQTSRFELLCQVRPSRIAHGAHPFPFLAQLPTGVAPSNEGLWEAGNGDFNANGERKNPKQLHPEWRRQSFQLHRLPAWCQLQRQATTGRALGVQDSDCRFQRRVWALGGRRRECKYQVWDERFPW